MGCMMTFHMRLLMTAMLTGCSNSIIPTWDVLDCNKLPTTFRSTMCEVSDAVFECCKSRTGWPCTELDKFENTTKDLLCGGVVLIEDTCCDSTVKRRAFSRFTCSSLSTADRAVLCEVTDVIADCCKVSNGIFRDLWNLENKTKDLICKGVELVERKYCSKSVVSIK